MKRKRKTGWSFGLHRVTDELVEKPSFLECLFGRGKTKTAPKPRQIPTSKKEMMDWLLS